ncbi:PSD1 and planctomycete cytochrome C domain-containing protein [Aureliella helgolandensis]|uniref:Planctomycete cytochrome C n=1 Tax=Aureliella helgolandensis TaxID=2527968 RepID=A0A518GA66_9BACT|nr:PSD1 and planctomycete cytochrome C domain-containing protein [Aureliella helgolandensis]QDV25481.1 Planctomycete cytochrome C [Aureliella helgolandensis]
MKFSMVSLRNLETKWESLLLLTVACLTCQVGGAPCLADEDNAALFVRRIAPLLQEKCIACHGSEAENIEGSLDLLSDAGWRSGSDSGVLAIVPGKADESPLFLAATREADEWSAMPPKDAERLTAEELGWLKEWIAGGATWPDQEESQRIALEYEDAWSVEDGVRLETSGGLSADWTNRRYAPESIWGYQPVRTPSANFDDAGMLDEFIVQRLPAGLAVAPPADRTQLIRRATFDLTGLPPSPEDVRRFVEDPRADDLVWAELVDRLLESPHYGERMAQHWLDVVRYADSSGFANDYDRGNAWRYRDYVVRAFNEDKPYDQFVREQIAGDEIAEQMTHSDAPPTATGSSVSELIVATGFLRMGPWELTSMEVAKVARQRFLDDATNSVGETFLAHSLQCARCHDHKFDPIPTRDYYSVQAVFATTQLCERVAPFSPQENVEGFGERKYLLKRKRELEQSLKVLNAKLTVSSGRAWLTEMGRDTAAYDSAVEKLLAALPLDPAEQAGSPTTQEERERGLSLGEVRKLMQQRKAPPELIPPAKAGFTPDDFGNERVARKGLERLKWELERYEPYALAVYNGRTPQVKSVSRPVRVPEQRMTQGELEQTCILTGGDPFASGMPVSPGVLSILGAVQTSPVPDSVKGRRLAFADWVASPDNPLTTRAIGNRIWMWHFNVPLAGNPNNFGASGKPPTHPELLDWLAARFVAKGWSFKSMHRVIMLSQAYQRSVSHPDPQRLSEVDPAGVSYAVFKPRRLTAEELRDAMLASTGELNPMLGGIPARPEINLEAAMQPRQVMGTFAAAWTPNPLPRERHRRSLYTLKLRGLVDPLLEVFNSPSPDFSCERRDTSMVTPQVFSLFNSQFSHARALALANRCLTEASNALGLAASGGGELAEAAEIAAIERLYQLAYSRSPTEHELQICLEHWRAVDALLPDEAMAAEAPAVSVRRDAVEENTGEHFSFEERLYANEDFVPDLQPADVNRRTRSLADVCLAILNSNEFIYLY